jgi:hypothetical protein
LLDFACGIPNLLHHLKLIGYKHLYGYDNFQQIQKKAVDEFCVNTGLQDSMIKFEDVNTKKITALSHSGYYIPNIEYKTLLSIPTLEYIFADYRYTPAPFLTECFSGLTQFENKCPHEITSLSLVNDYGFKPIAVYDGLLLIYKKTK